MSTTCSFGQIKDGRFRSICINGKEVIDKDRNIKCIKSFSANKACIKSINTVKVDEKKNNRCVVVDKAIPLNPHGYGRIYLGSEVAKYADSEVNEIINSNDWNISYETFGPNTLLLEGHHFTTPSLADYTNACLTEWCALVEVCVQLKVQSNVANDGDGVFEINLTKNSTDVVSRTCVKTYDEDPTTRSVHLCDTIKCLPEDTLDIFVKFDEGSVDFIDGSEQSHATFKIVALMPAPK